MFFFKSVNSFAFEINKVGFEDKIYGTYKIQIRKKLLALVKDLVDMVTV
jgi:hypothetical protein